MRYITCPGSADRQLFESGFSRVRATGRPIVLSRQYLAQFGRIRIPAPLWQALGQYACRLDPVIVREWRQLTANRDSTANRHSATKWEPPRPTTRSRIGMTRPKADRQQTTHSSGPKAATSPAWRWRVKPLTVHQSGASPLCG